MSIPAISQPVPRHDITIKQNATFSLVLCIVQRESDGSTSVVDTEDWEAVLQVRAEPTQTSDVLLEASTDNGRIVMGIQGDPGEEINIDIKVPAEITAALEWFGCAGYDLLVIYPGGDHDYYAEGQAIIQPAYSWEAP